MDRFKVLHRNGDSCERGPAKTGTHAAKDIGFPPIDQEEFFEVTLMLEGLELNSERVFSADGDRYTVIGATVSSHGSLYFSQPSTILLP